MYRINGINSTYLSLSLVTVLHRCSYKICYYNFLGIFVEYFLVSWYTRFDLCRKSSCSSFGKLLSDASNQRRHRIQIYVCVYNILHTVLHRTTSLSLTISYKYLAIILTQYLTLNHYLVFADDWCLTIARAARELHLAISRHNGERKKNKTKTKKLPSALETNFLSNELNNIS